MKMEALGCTTGEVSERRGKSPLVIQTGSMRQFLQRRPGDPVDQQTREGSLSLEQWEIQWQEFLRTLESPQSPWGISYLPEKPSPWEDAKVFLASFERVAEACQWPKEEWVTRLLPALSGEAEKTFEKLDIPDREDYGKVKAAILRGDALSREKQREEFRCFRFQEADGPRGAYSRLRETCRGWLRVENHSKEQILELLILEQLLSILPPEIQIRVRESGPESCSQAVALAEEFLLRQQEAERQKKQVLLEEEAESIAETDQDTSENEQKKLSVGIKEEEDGEGILLGDVQENGNDGGLQVLLLDKVKNEDLKRNFGDSDGSERQDRNCVVERNGNPIPCQDGEFQATPVQEDKASKKRRNKGVSTHLRIYSMENQNKSVELGKSFSESTHLISHQRIHSVEKLYKCSECGESFSRRTALAFHQRIHKGGELCENSYSWQPHQEEYEMIHKEEKLSEYSEAEKSISDHRSLAVQHRTPKMERRYKCLKCGKRFKCVSHLQQHQTLHTGEKPYQCSECGNKFTRASSLQQHRRIHTGERPYECSVCGRRFGRTSHLKKHQRVHTSEKPYECSECGKRFGFSSYLRQHQWTHKGEKPYECSECGKRFGFSSYLRKHQWTHKNL